MHTMRNLYGGMVSATITGAIYSGPLLLGLLGASVPMEQDVYVEPVRAVVIQLEDYMTDLAEEVVEAADGEAEGEAVEEAVARPSPKAPSAPAQVAAAPSAPILEPTPDLALPLRKPSSAKPEAKPSASPEAKPEVLASALAVQRVRRPAVKLVSKNSDRTGRCGPDHPDIKREAPGVWDIERSLVSYHTRSIRHLNELGYSKQYHEDGQKGWLVGGFGCKGALWKGGLRPRDVVQSVNGHKTNNVLQILVLWGKLKKQKEFEVEVLRRGKPMTLRYHVD